MSDAPDLPESEWLHTYECLNGPMEGKHVSVRLMSPGWTVTFTTFNDMHIYTLNDDVQLVYTRTVEDKVKIDYGQYGDELPGLEVSRTGLFARWALRLRNAAHALRVDNPHQDCFR